MRNQVALVTGGVRGIGLAICARLAARGVTVAAGYSKDKETAQRFVDTYGPEKASIHQGNIGSNQDCERVVQEVLDRHGRLDILVTTPESRWTARSANDAGGLEPGGRSEPFRGLLPQPGHPAAHAGPGFGPHHHDQLGDRILGKHRPGELCRRQVRSLRTDHEPRPGDRSEGHHGHSVTPGFISTEMTAAVPPAAMERVVAKIPVGRLGEPDEVARVVEFLADPDSGYITGQVYAVNGGLYM